MQANELRIGNWVYYSGRVFRISELLTGYCRIKTKISQTGFMSVGYMQIKPIPLTEDILLKAGFDGAKCPNNIFAIGRVDDDFIKNQMTLVFDKKLILKIKYLHQLQNLYFTLTQKEL